ncbi:hypothetical protein DY000_02026513 [Brassica cretica]|uniref:Uncharacterized protein n=1 Tax=Brassica cretica TaxID=69181 RepID=A0ABQ7DZP4_BRACR|nr:hypothetical protein DY000_02026511 [Brassica cretica]KAF3596403.1 hypothetical protein DY000_02026513 [Brassica cretica]
MEGPPLARQMSRDERMFRRLRVKHENLSLSLSLSLSAKSDFDVSSGGSRRRHLLRCSRRRHLLRWLYSATSLSVVLPEATELSVG